MEPIHIVEIIGVAAMTAFMIFILVRVLKRARGAIEDRPLDQLVQVEAGTDNRFELRYTVEKSVPLRLFLTYHLHSMRTGGTATRGFSGMAGLAVRLDFHVNGAHTATMTIGKGSEVPCEVDHMEPLAYNEHTWTGGSDYHVKATMPVLSIGPRSVGSKLAFKGEIILNQFTDASELTLFLSTA